MHCTQRGLDSVLQHIHSHYLAVKAKRITDLIGYQSITIGASQLGHDGRWILYDHGFHLKASSSCTKQWSTIDITIWNMAFPDRAIKSHPGQGFNLCSSPLNYSQHPPHQNQQEDVHLSDSPNGCIQTNGPHTEDLFCDYNKWISAWTSHLGRSSPIVKVPPEASAISTPVR